MDEDIEIIELTDEEKEQIKRERIDIIELTFKYLHQIENIASFVDKINVSENQPLNAKKDEKIK